MNEIRHYVIGEQVIVYEPEYKDQMSRAREINERLRIFGMPTKTEDKLDGVWKDTKDATYLGREAFDNLSCRLNYVEIEYNPNTEQVDNVRVSSNEADNRYLESFSRSWPRKEVDTKTLEEVLNEARELFLEKRRMILEMTHYKIFVHPSKDGHVMTAKNYLRKLR